MFQQPSRNNFILDIHSVLHHNYFFNVNLAKWIIWNDWRRFSITKCKVYGPWSKSRRFSDWNHTVRKPIIIENWTNTVRTIYNVKYTVNCIRPPSKGPHCRKYTVFMTLMIWPICSESESILNPTVNLNWPFTLPPSRTFT